MVTKISTDDPHALRECLRELDDARVRLAEAERRVKELHAVLETVPAAIYITRDRLSQHMETNRFGAELMRVPIDANVSKSAPEDQRPQTFRAMKDGLEVSPTSLPVQVAAAEGIEVRDYEFDLVTEDGFSRHLIGNASTLLDDAGRAFGAVGAFVDVTAVRVACEKLERSEKRLAAVVEGTDDGHFDLDVRTGVIYRSPRYWAIAGWPEGALPPTSNSFLALVHPDEVEQVRAAATKILTGAVDQLDEEYRLRSSAGTWTWVHARLKIVGRVQTEPPPGSRGPSVTSRAERPPSGCSPSGRRAFARSSARRRSGSSCLRSTASCSRRTRPSGRCWGEKMPSCAP